jgi:Na+/proline symporter
MSAKDEQHSLLATLWFNIAHYTLRPWPWILVALAALVLLPRKSDPQQLEQMNPALFERVVKAYESKEIILNRGHSSYSPEFIEMYETYENTIDPGVMYPKLMVRYLPAGLLGLLIAVFMAAYMSTIASQLNWGTSYIINDFYKRFIRTDATEKHYVLISRAGIVLMMFFSLFIAKVFLTTIKGAWEFIINASAGMGAVLILRWFWWRINAWSEIAAMLAPLIIYPVSVKYFGLEPPLTLYPTVLGTTIIWLAVTFLTKPVHEKKLAQFYRVIHPGGPGWKGYRTKYPEIQPDTHYGRQLINWICGIIAIYAVMNGTGSIIFHDYVKGAITLVIAFAAGYVIYLNLKKS